MTKEQAQKKNKGKGEGKGKTQGKNRGKGFSFLDQETTAEGSGGAGPEPDPPSNGNFGDLKFELGSFTLQQESSKLKWLGGMARGKSDAKRWSKNAAGRGQHWIQVNYDSDAAVAAFPRHFAEGAVCYGAQNKTATGELTTDCGGARILGRVNGGPLRRNMGSLVDADKTPMSASTCARLGLNGLADQRWKLVNAGPYYFAYVMIISQPSSHASPGGCGRADNS